MRYRQDEEKSAVRARSNDQDSEDCRVETAGWGRARGACLSAAYGLFRDEGSTPGDTSLVETTGLVQPRQHLYSLPRSQICSHRLPP
ncbi:hypothetical protein AAFF_G00105800 [Aldrovandia affinis]|uniref:Uncharacterized protein n=1 Tax=Aldrovandia affinis TaxID=143900 RepID=A0AAD7T2V7_9TELE|nr:hypothetical protein AAFF_G00105800 [Aldrovandia affinis]